MREYRYMYIPGTLCKGARRAARVSAHSAARVSAHSAAEYEGLFDFVMSHYADLVYMLRYESVDVRCLM